MKDRDFRRGGKPDAERRRLAALRRKAELPLRGTRLFPSFGSKFFVENVRSGLDSLIADISMVKGYMNFDMIGGNNKPDVPEHFVYFYTASEKRYEDWMTGGIERYSLELAPDIRAWDYPAGGSDNTYFAKYGVPVIWYHTDAHPYYHRPSDHADKVNMSKVVDISRLSFMTFYCMANENL